MYIPEENIKQRGSASQCIHETFSSGMLEVGKISRQGKKKEQWELGFGIYSDLFCSVLSRSGM